MNRPLGDYQLLRRIARTGVGETFLARRAGKSGPEATFLFRCLLEAPGVSADLTTRFLRAARLASGLSHPNLAQIYDCGVADGTAYLAMEHLAGEDLGAIRRRLRAQGRTLPVETALQIAVDVCAGLAHAHGNRESGIPLPIVHGELSPSNVIVTYQGLVKVVDVAIAGASTPPGAPHSGAFDGKEPFVAPEQLRGDPLDPRSDLFSLGVTLFSLLTDVHPFQRDTDAGTRLAILNEDPPDLRALRPDLPDAVAALILQMLERDPDDRFVSANALRAGLEGQLAVLAPTAGAATLAAFMADLFGADAVEASTLLPTPTSTPAITAAPPTAPARSPAAGAAAAARSPGAGAAPAGSPDARPPRAGASRSPGAGDAPAGSPDARPPVVGSVAGFAAARSPGAGAAGQAAPTADPANPGETAAPADEDDLLEDAAEEVEVSLPAVAGRSPPDAAGTAEVMEVVEEILSAELDAGPREPWAATGDAPVEPFPARAVYTGPPIAIAPVDLPVSAPGGATIFPSAPPVETAGATPGVGIGKVPTSPLPLRPPGERPGAAAAPPPPQLPAAGPSPGPRPLGIPASPASAEPGAGGAGYAGTRPFGMSAPPPTTAEPGAGGAGYAGTRPFGITAPPTTPTEAGAGGVGYAGTRPFGIPAPSTTPAEPAAGGAGYAGTRPFGIPAPSTTPAEPAAGGAALTGTRLGMPVPLMPPTEPAAGAAGYAGTRPLGIPAPTAPAEPAAGGARGRAAGGGTEPIPVAGPPFPRARPVSGALGEPVPAAQRILEARTEPIRVPAPPVPPVPAVEEATPPLVYRLPTEPTGTAADGQITDGIPIRALRRKLRRKPSAVVFGVLGALGAVGAVAVVGTLVLRRGPDRGEPEERASTAVEPTQPTQPERTPPPTVARSQPPPPPPSEATSEDEESTTDESVEETMSGPIRPGERLQRASSLAGPGGPFQGKALQKSVRLARRRFAVCFYRHGESLSKPPSQLTMYLRVSGAGRVTGADVNLVSIEDEPLANCLEREAARVRFPRHGAAEVRFTLSIAPNRAVRAGR